MKKNLFGAVAAGLALALAITSFGCESGNDDPIARPTDADLAGVVGSKFEFVAAPTEYTVILNATPAADETLTKAGIKAGGTAAAGYENIKYVDGVLNYNTANGEWGKVDLSKTPTIGDVVKTKAETITLNAKDNTFEYGASSTNYVVKQLWWHSTAPSTNAAAYSVITAAIGGSRTDPNDDDISAALSQTKQDALADAKAAVATAQKNYDTTYATLSASDKRAYDALPDTAAGKGSDGTMGTLWTALKNAKDALEPLQNNFDWVTVWKEGARYSIESTKTVNGATTGSIRYVKSLDKQELVKEVSKAGGTAKATATGKYKVVSGSYLTGEILITSYTKGGVTYEFNDDADTYIKTGLHVARKISEDFNQTTTQGWSENSKKARTLSISNKTLTAPQFETTASSVAEGSKAYAYFLSSSFTTPKRAVDQYNREQTVSTATGLNAVSYSYVWK